MPKAAEYRLRWHAERGGYELREHQSERLVPVAPDEYDWFAWLDTVPSFTFHGRHGQLTVRKESRSRGEGYWYAYRVSVRRWRRSTWVEPHTSRWLAWRKWPPCSLMLKRPLPRKQPLRYHRMR
jgi:hypothetical protein